MLIRGPICKEPGVTFFRGDTFKFHPGWKYFVPVTCDCRDAKSSHVIFEQTNGGWKGNGLRQSEECPVCDTSISSDHFPLLISTAKCVVSSQVINALQKAIDCTEKEATDLATTVDRDVSSFFSPAFHELLPFATRNILLVTLIKILTREGAKWRTARFTNVRRRETSFVWVFILLVFERHFGLKERPVESCISAFSSSWSVCVCWSRGALADHLAVWITSCDRAAFCAFSQSRSYSFSFSLQHQTARHGIQGLKVLALHTTVVAHQIFAQKILTWLYNLIIQCGKISRVRLWTIYRPREVVSRGGLVHHAGVVLLAGDPLPPWGHPTPDPPNPEPPDPVSSSWWGTRTTLIPEPPFLEPGMTWSCDMGQRKLDSFPPKRHCVKPMCCDMVWSGKLCSLQRVWQSCFASCRWNRWNLENTRWWKRRCCRSLCCGKVNTFSSAGPSEKQQNTAKLYFWQVWRDFRTWPWGLVWHTSFLLVQEIDSTTLCSKRAVSVKGRPFVRLYWPLTIVANCHCTSLNKAIWPWKTDCQLNRRLCQALILFVYLCFRRQNCKSRTLYGWVSAPLFCFLSKCGE